MIKKMFTMICMMIENPNKTTTAVVSRMDRNKIERLIKRTSVFLNILQVHYLQACFSHQNYHLSTTLHSR